MRAAFGSQFFAGPSSCEMSRRKIREKKESRNVWENWSREEKSCKCSNILLYISLYMFVSCVLGWIRNQSSGRRKEDVAFGRPALYFPWLSHSRRQTADHWNWADGAAWIEEDVNFLKTVIWGLKVISLEFLWCGVRANAPSIPAFNTPGRICFLASFCSCKLVPVDTSVLRHKNCL